MQQFQSAKDLNDLNIEAVSGNIELMTTLQYGGEDPV